MVADFGSEETLLVPPYPLLNIILFSVPVPVQLCVQFCVEMFVGLLCLFVCFDGWLVA